MKNNIRNIIQNPNTTISFTKGNSDEIILRGYIDAVFAFSEAKEFLEIISADDTECNYTVDVFHEDFNEDGSIRFKVKSTDK